MLSFYITKSKPEILGHIFNDVPVEQVTLDLKIIKEKNMSKFDEMYDRSTEEKDKVLKEKKKPLERERMKSSFQENYREFQSEIFEIESELSEYDVSIEHYDLEGKYNNVQKIEELKKRREFIAKEYEELFGEKIPGTESK